MTDYWKRYWDKHLASMEDDNLFRQVLRVQNKKPQSADSFDRMLEHLTRHLDMASSHHLLDLCCGNGLITERLANSVGPVIAVDFCAGLLEGLEKKQIPCMTCVLGDVLDLALTKQAFDRILLAAALQHFTENQVIQLFENAAGWLKPGGKWLITDILDQGKRWNFFNSLSREKAYFDSLKSEKPLLGTWFTRDWLIRLASYTGFSKTTVISQPRDLIYSHYRFDLLLEQ